MKNNQKFPYNFTISNEWIDRHKFLADENVKNWEDLDLKLKTFQKYLRQESVCYNHPYGGELECKTDEVRRYTYACILDKLELIFPHLLIKQKGSKNAH